MKHVLFRRVFIAYLLITTLLLISLEFYLSSSIKNNYILDLSKSILIQARLIAGQIPSSFEGNLDDFCKKYKETTGARVTIIDNTGLVLGDSDEPSEKMENHLNRQEIKDAEIGDVGSSIRYSKTLQRNLFYLAITFHNNQDKYFLRLSIPLHDIDSAMNVIRLKIIVASLAVSFIIVVFGLLQTRRITKSVEEIAAFSREVAAGSFRKRLLLKEKDELGELGENINDMARNLGIRLRQSEEEKARMEAILKNMSDGLVLTDAKGKIIMGNAALNNLFGIDYSGMQGKTLLEALRKTELMDMVESIAESGGKVSREIQVAYPRELYLLTTAAPFALQGEISGIVLTFHDITRLRKLEEVRKDFVANVSHEIRTPITAIKGFAETLLEGALEDKENALKFLESIKNNSERLNSLVNDLLALSRIELGDIKIEKKIVDLDEVIDSVFTTLRDKADKKKLFLKKTLPADIIELEADRDRLVQILLNLVDNGIKFTEAGGVTVKVQREKKDTDSSPISPAVEISVEDTGMGIPRKYLSRLGERFYRVDRARSRELGGTGLGLAIVKHLVKAQGWEMEIESTEGKGTTVKILCPVV
jgi:two-component system, OmpR family, phosphate regulon sensor histidine kinase PhoR